jgi:hypothetical protein
VIIGPDGETVLDAKGNPLLGQQKTYDGTRAEEDALATALVGLAVGKRRWERKTTGSLIPDKPTKENLMAFWGDALPNMPRVGGGIFVI